MKRTHTVATTIGLAIALFAIPLFVAGYRRLTGPYHSNLQLVIRDAGVLILVALLLWLVKTQESLPFASIGWQNRLGRSLVRGCVLALSSLLVTVGLYVLFQHFDVHLGESDRGSFQPSLWVIVLGMLRAGIAEEIFYRGYAIERLQSLTGNTWLAASVPLVVFAASHYPQGLGGVIAVFVIGAVATVFYVKFRDLGANIIGHSLVDIVLNVLLPLVSGH
jgi:membrane protease YdiL (CAAX protease family)